MQDWINEIDSFLKMTKKDILKDSGKCLMNKHKKTHEEYDKYMQEHLTFAEQSYLEVLNKKIKKLINNIFYSRFSVEVEYINISKNNMI